MQFIGPEHHAGVASDLAKYLNVKEQHAQVKGPLFLEKVLLGVH
jgi:hypothetical protein